MNPLFAVLLLIVATTTALADSPEAILKDYRKQATQAVEPLNQKLEKATTPLITQLEKQGDAAGAELLTNQYKDKLAGEPVPEPQASAAQVFALYDDARAKALAPIQKTSLARIESQMKLAGGLKGEALAEMEKVREEVAAGKISRDLGFPGVWLCRPPGPPRGPGETEELTLLPDGRWSYKSLVTGEVTVSGDWVKVNAKRNTFTLNRKGAAPWTLSFNKDSGLLQRPGDGVRFLRLPPKA